MGKRYYCDYCDRTLPYSVEARKKHHAGHQHRNAKQKYYASFKSAAERFEEETLKKDCKRFFSGQNCSFGENCIYSHLTESSLLLLKNEAENEISPKHIPSQILRGSEPNVDQITSQLEMKSNSENWIENILHSYSEPNAHFRDHQPLPPSLKPINLEDLLEVQLNNWG